MEGGRTAAEDDEDTDGDEAAVRGVGEVLVPPGGRQATKAGKDGVSDDLRTAMEDMGVG